MKRVLSILIVLLLVGGIFVFVGCGDKETTVEKLTIKFEPLNDAAIADLEIKADSTFTLPTPTREGYVFQGWFLEDTYQTQATVDSLKQMLKEGNVTLYAKWDEDVPPAPTGLTVHFNAKGGNAVTDATLQADTEYTLPVATREGYDFKGWFFEEGYQTAVTVEGLKAKIADGATTIYAKWEEKQLVVQFNTKEGNQIDNRTWGYSLLDLVTLPIPTKEGHDFQGWCFEQNCQTPVDGASLKQKIDDGTVTIYAKWDEKSVILIFDTKGFDDLDNLTVKYTAIDTQVLPTPNGLGVEFQGWYFDDGYQTAYSVQDLKEKIADGSVTLHAKWEDVTVTLRFNTAGGNVIGNTDVAFSAIEDQVLPTPERSYHKFARWYFDENYQTEYTTQGLKQRASQGIVDLYAKWGNILASDTITIQGKSAEKAGLNPMFDWTNAANDTQFEVVIKNATGSVVERGVVTAPHYVLTDNLAYDNAYTIEITGTPSDCYRSVTFTTVEGTGTVDLNEVLLAVAEPFKSHMVIQRGKAINITGMTAPKTLVSIDFYGERKYAISDGSTGMFTFAFAAKEANATPANVTISLLKNKTLVLEDVLIGDVYLVSGQSNVQRTLAECSVRGETPDWAADVPDAIQYGVRYYYQAENTSATPALSTKNAFWFKVPEGDDTYKSYSAVAFMVGAMLGKELSSDGVPVGIIYAAKGNTNITSWKGGSSDSLHFNGMIYPLQTAEISGVVWYQGCNNSGKGIDYLDHLTALMSNWRALFRNAELPFYVVQLPCFNGDSGNNYDFSYVRESQLKACQADENAYLIATCDGGDPDDIHPKAKRYLCERIAKSILSTVYGKDYLPEGPTFASREIEGSNYIITVNNGEGLTFTGDAIVGFMLAGEDGKYFDATATIENGKIVVTSAQVANPVNVKYGFSKCPFLNVYNKDGFLMSPFRTDVYNHNIDLLDYRANAAYASNSGGETMAVEVVDVDGEVGLQVTKPEGTKGYGILELPKWGAIGYEEHALKLRIKGSNSGAKLVIRIVEGSYEMWATPALTDNFTTVQEMTIPISYLTVSNEVNGIIDFQSINRVELIIKDKSAAVTVTVLELRFVDYTRTAPAAFNIKEAKQDGVQGTIKWGFADFAASYVVRVATDTTFTGSNLVVDGTTTGLNYTFDASVIEDGVTYYVAVAAINNLGQTIATNSGMVLRNANRADVASFDFDNDEDFNTYVTAKLYNENTSNLEFARDDKGLKVHIKQTSGWMAFFARVDAGTSAGFDTLKVYLDLTEYKGSTLKIQLQTNGGSTSYTYQLNFSSKKEGYFEIPFSAFVNSSTGAYNGGDIVRVKFGFTDYVAGANDNVYVNNISFIKAAQS